MMGCFWVDFMLSEMDSWIEKESEKRGGDDGRVTGKMDIKRWGVGGKCIA
jgi:hypothetical protein